MSAKMTQERAELILKKLAVFDSLERRNTDQIGWIALHFGVARHVADRMITEARSMRAAEVEP